MHAYNLFPVLLTVSHVPILHQEVWIIFFYNIYLIMTPSYFSRLVMLHFIRMNQVKLLVEGKLTRYSGSHV
jgi:hypothetical protein